MRLRLAMICVIGGFLIAWLNVRSPAQEVAVGKEWKPEPPADCPFEASDDRLYSPFTAGQQVRVVPAGDQTADTNPQHSFFQSPKRTLVPSCAPTRKRISFNPKY